MNPTPTTSSSTASGALEVHRESGGHSALSQVPEGLPPELQTPAWIAAFKALNYSDPAERIRDDDLYVRAFEDRWAADFRRFFPCCGVGGDQIHIAARDLESLAQAIVEECKRCDPRCPNTSDHSRLR